MNGSKTSKSSRSTKKQDRQQQQLKQQWEDQQQQILKEQYEQQKQRKQRHHGNISANPTKQPNQFPQNSHEVHTVHQRLQRQHQQLSDELEQLRRDFSERGTSEKNYENQHPMAKMQSQKQSQTHRDRVQQKKAMGSQTQPNSQSDVAMSQKPCLKKTQKWSQSNIRSQPPILPAEDHSQTYKQSKTHSIHSTPSPPDMTELQWLSNDDEELKLNSNSDKQQMNQFDHQFESNVDWSVAKNSDMSEKVEDSGTSSTGFELDTIWDNSEEENDYWTHQAKGMQHETTFEGNAHSNGNRTFVVKRGSSDTPSTDRTPIVSNANDCKSKKTGSKRNSHSSSLGKIHEHFDAVAEDGNVGNYGSPNLFATSTTEATTACHNPNQESAQPIANEDDISSASTNNSITTGITGTTQSTIFSKHVLVRLMREQVNLVRSLTNAQISQKKELDRIKEEKLKLEMEQNRQKDQNQQHERQSQQSQQSQQSLRRAWEKQYRNQKNSSSSKIRWMQDECSSVGNVTPSIASTIIPEAIVVNSSSVPNSTNDKSQTPRIEIIPTPERDVLGRDEHDDSCTSSCLTTLWILFSRLCTLFIPDACIVWTGKSKQSKQAWREKIALMYVMLFASAAFVGVSGVIPMVLCRETTVFTMDEIEARMRFGREEAWTVVFGTIYDVTDFVDEHPGGEVIEQVIGKDASKYFPRRPPGILPSICLNPDKEISRQPECDEFDAVDKLVNSYCHSAAGFVALDEDIGKFERGVFAHRLSDLEETDWVMIYGRIYNVTKYMKGLEEDDENDYLNADLTSLIVNKRGQDATDVYEALYDDDVALSCMDDLFYVGVLDDEEDILCKALNIAMYSVMIIIAAALSLQCICSLVYLVRIKRTITRNDVKSKIIVMVPCYNEGDKQLRKTIDSVMDSSYPEQNLCLLVVADGIVTGKNESTSTPDILSKILGFDMSKKDAVHKCTSVGELTENRAKLYHGIYKDCGKELKYIVIVKCGLYSEKGSPLQGNRGKRDSQLLFTGLLNRYQHGRRLNELDKAIKRALDRHLMPLDEIQYLLTIDADTRIDRESISHMAYSMGQNEKILALCGETKVENKAQSLVTMVQVFEYYTNHHMKKAFESAFGCVTCLPGCFTMYRIFSSDGRPLLSCDDVYQRYGIPYEKVNTLHKNNLFLLGEDRMLTTLLLRYFPDMRLSFVPEAVCHTIVPSSFRVLLSQRRRWTNSTFHNMLELLRVNSMCGICCLSMKSVVALDLIGALILPASLVYVGYIVYITVWLKEPLSVLMLVIWGIVVGVQIAVFLLRSRWDYWWWFIVYVLVGVPIFYFILPIYSFWNMDNFSWGATRQVKSKADPIGTIAKSDDETDYSESVGDSPNRFRNTEIVAEPLERGKEISWQLKFTEQNRKKSKSATKSRGMVQACASQRRSVSVDYRAQQSSKYSGPIDVDLVSVDDYSCEVSINPSVHNPHDNQNRGGCPKGEF